MVADFVRSLFNSGLSCLATEKLDSISTYAATSMADANYSVNFVNANIRTWFYEHYVYPKYNLSAWISKILNTSLKISI